MREAIGSLESSRLWVLRNSTEELIRWDSRFGTNSLNNGSDQSKLAVNVADGGCKRGDLVFRCSGNVIEMHKEAGEFKHA